MSARNKSIITPMLLVALCAPWGLISAAKSAPAPSLAQDTIATQLGWITDDSRFCSGYYFDQPITTNETDDPNAYILTTQSGMLSQRAASTLEGQVGIKRHGQELTANKAILYRDPVTAKLTTIDLIGNVNLHEENSLIVGRKGHYNFETENKALMDILYRTKLNMNLNLTKQKRKTPPPSLTAWGQADSFSQSTTNVYELSQASYSTCPPINPAWRLRASHIVLNKNTGRGYATHARVYLKDVPVFYFPYINFPIDKQRKSGFLWPTIGRSDKWGPFILAPFYWNMAPNADMTITPGLLTNRGMQWSDHFRYLTETSSGNINFTILPNDKAFHHYISEAEENPDSVKPTNPDIQTPEVTEAEYERLLEASDTRYGFLWHNRSIFNENWSSQVDFSYASDDYYLRDFGRSLKETSANQLLQEADLFYKSEHWDFTGRLQAYQTLHPIDEAPVLNQYRRFPQLVLNGSYPDQAYGLEYFISNEVTHFDILKTPGAESKPPVGNRLHTQPGVSLPLYWSSFYINPRAQAALTQYNLRQLNEFNEQQPINNQTGTNLNRALPIIDIISGISLERNISFFSHAYQQTLEPQLYYTYIPYRDQSDIPVFDTTVNTLTFDQIFNYNRFTGIDRIGDANQLGIGVTTRLIDSYTGLEKVRFAIGDIIYFANRKVTLCNDDTCSDNPNNPNNREKLSPVSAVLNYHINKSWSFNTNAIWNPINKQLDNTTVAFQYQPDELRLFNLGYTYARSGDILSGVSTIDSANNLKVTDISAAWPLYPNVRVVGRWGQNWNRQHLQNLLYGLQYDTCCWAVQLVGGRTFTTFDTNTNRPKYNTEAYIQFSLKGLGDFGSGNPAGMLNNIPGYNTQFSQDI